MTHGLNHDLNQIHPSHKGSQSIACKQPLLQMAPKAMEMNSLERWGRTSRGEGIHTPWKYHWPILFCIAFFTGSDSCGLGHPFQAHFCLYMHGKLARFTGQHRGRGGTEQDLMFVKVIRAPKFLVKSFFAFQLFSFKPSALKQSKALKTKRALEDTTGAHRTPNEGHSNAAALLWMVNSQWHH